MVARSSTEPVVKVTAADMLALLRARYSMPQWALVTSVCESTGNNRRCDAMAVGQWMSVGQHLHGFEIKVARSDWKREIQDTAKAETFAQFCDYWWIAAPKGVALLEEMPATWGLLEPLNGGLTVRKAATKLDPRPLSRDLLVMLTRRAAEQSPATEVLVKAKAAARAEGYESGKAAGLREADPENLRKESERLTKKIAEFEERSGVQIDTYNLGNIADAVKIALGGLRAAEVAKRNAEYARDTMKRAMEVLTTYIDKQEGPERDY